MHTCIPQKMLGGRLRQISIDLGVLRYLGVQEWRCYIEIQKKTCQKCKAISNEIFKIYDCHKCSIKNFVFKSMSPLGHPGPPCSRQLSTSNKPCSALPVSGAWVERHTLKKSGDTCAAHKEAMCWMPWGKWWFYTLLTVPKSAKAVLANSLFVGGSVWMPIKLITNWLFNAMF